MLLHAVKDRRVILTRSKSKDDENEKPNISKNKNKKKERDKVSEVRESRRNAPSPDIIDGLRHKKISSSSESSSSSSGKFNLKERDYCSVV